VGVRPGLDKLKLVLLYGDGETGLTLTWLLSRIHHRREHAVDVDYRSAGVRRNIAVAVGLIKGQRGRSRAGAQMVTCSAGAIGSIRLLAALVAAPTVGTAEVIA
jgi:hypothetical protein